MKYGQKVGGITHAGVAQLGQRRWDEVPVHIGSQVQILPSALQALFYYTEVEFDIQSSVGFGKRPRNRNQVSLEKSRA